MNQRFTKAADQLLAEMDDRTMVEQLVLSDSLGFGGYILREGEPRPTIVDTQELAPLLLLDASGFRVQRFGHQRTYSTARALVGALMAADAAAVSLLAEQHLADIEAVQPELVYDSPLSWARSFRGELLSVDTVGFRSWLMDIRRAMGTRGYASSARRGDSLSLAESFAVRLHRQGIEVVTDEGGTLGLGVSPLSPADSSRSDSTFRIVRKAEDWERAGLIWSLTPTATVDSLLNDPAFDRRKFASTLRRAIVYRLWSRAQASGRSGEGSIAALGAPSRLGVPPIDRDVIPLATPVALGDRTDTLRFLAQVRAQALTKLPAAPEAFLDLPSRVTVINASSALQDQLQHAVHMYVPYDWEELACRETLPDISVDTTPLIVLLGPQLSTDSLQTLSAWVQRSRNPRRPVHIMTVGHPERLALLPSDLTYAYLPEASVGDWQRLLALPFGGSKATGRLPEDVGPWREGDGAIHPVTRLKPADFLLHPIDVYGLAEIPAIVLEGIRSGATPGAQIAVVRDGELIYDESFGQLAPGERRVRREDRYDLASLTKVVATTLAVMKLYEEGLVDLEAPISRYVNGLPGATGKLKVRQLLRHATGLRRDLPITTEIRLGKGYQPVNCKAKFCRKATAKYSVPVAKDVYYDRAAQSRLRAAAKASVPNQRARYGDLNFFLLQQMIERVSGVGLDRYVDSVFYQPLGVALTYLPLAAGDAPLIASAIAPTEYDWHWRRQRLRGYVHDEAAALMGGVAGHAGVFGSARDVAVVFAMLSAGGAYGGRRYLSPETVETFTASKPKERRALGFAKIDRPGKSAKTGALPLYGHTGFTGTAVWSDPDRNIVVVFTSNRIYGGKGNWRLQKGKIRERVLEAVYRATRPQP